MSNYALGLDYGTDSVRALLVDTGNGDEVASSVSYYSRWSQGLYCVAQKDQFRQHPLDYLESLELCLKELWQKAPTGAAGQVVGISVDTTGSTPIAVDETGQALALKEEFRDNPNAMFILWKDHTAISEAEEITASAKNAQRDYTEFCGGIYSSEWYWAKLLRASREDPRVASAAYMWVEHCDWIPAVLTGTEHPQKIGFGRCAAGHKMLWAEAWGGFPPEAFFSAIDPVLAGLRDRLPSATFTSENKVGELTGNWADRLGLRPGIPVGFGAFDCHMGAVAAMVKPGVLTKVMGTSTCDITVAAKDSIKNSSVRGICGQVDGSVLPGMIGLEAGQSAFGDVYAWYEQLLNWPLQNLIPTLDYIDVATRNRIEQDIRDQTLVALTNAAQKLTDEESPILALDWLNGRRTPDADQRVAMSIFGLKMGADAPRLYKSLVLATAFGAKAIIERFASEGISVESVVAIGGISKKSDFVMQICADTWNLPVAVLESEQSCALGAAIFAAVVGGAFSSVAAAQEVMGSTVCKTYVPNPDKQKRYNQMYRQYLQLGEYVNEASR